MAERFELVEKAILNASTNADFPVLFSPIIALTPLLKVAEIPTSSKALKFRILTLDIYIITPHI